MNVGGPAWQVTALTQRLDPGRFETRLVAGSVAPGEADYVALRAPGLAAHTIPSLGRAVGGDDALALAAVVAEIRRFQPHVVHTHTAKAGVLGRVAARLCGVPATVHTFHGHVLRGYFGPAVTRVVQAQERSLARGTTRLVAVGDGVRRELLGLGIGSPAQYRVIPPGVELAPLPPVAAARRLLGLPEEGPVVLFVGRFAAIKQPLRFVEVAALLHRRHPGAAFVMAGDGPLAGGLRQAADRLRVPVRLLPWRADVETLYAAADVVVLTSDNEGMPVSLIEASMAGRPCVATAVGSTAEVVEHGVTGFVTSTDTVELAAAVDALLGDPVRRAGMGAAAARRAAARFPVARLVADTERLYDEIAREVPAARPRGAAPAAVG